MYYYNAAEGRDRELYYVIQLSCTLRQFMVLSMVLIPSMQECNSDSLLIAHDVRGSVNSCWLKKSTRKYSNFT